MTEVDRIVSEMRRSFHRVIALVAPPLVAAELARLNAHLREADRIDLADEQIEVFVTRTGIVVFKLGSRLYRLADDGGAAYILLPDGRSERLERFENGQHVRAVHRRRGAKTPAGQPAFN